LGLAVVSEAFFAAVLFMAIATTLIAPPFIKILFAGEEAAREKTDADDAGGIIHETDDWSRIG
jgi:Kef-type K+ transport system membrane component KefB